MSNIELLPCPFCGEGSEIVVCDEEGNLHGEEYEKQPWSGLSYRVFHPSETCPVGHLEPDEPKWLYDTKSEAIEAWNTRYEPPKLEPIFACASAPVLKDEQAEAAYRKGRFDERLQQQILASAV